MRHRGKIRLYNWIGGNEMKKCKLCKMTALFCAAFLTVCAFLWNMQSVQGDGDTALYYWGFENTTGGRSRYADIGKRRQLYCRQAGTGTECGRKRRC